MAFANVLCLIPENVYGRLSVKNNGKWTGSWCQLFYRKSYGYFFYSVSSEIKEYRLDTISFFIHTSTPFISN